MAGFQMEVMPPHLIFTILTQIPHSAHPQTLLTSTAQCNSYLSREGNVRDRSMNSNSFSQMARGNQGPVLLLLVLSSCTKILHHHLKGCREKQQPEFQLKTQHELLPKFRQPLPPEAVLGFTLDLKPAWWSLTGKADT